MSKTQLKKELARMTAEQMAEMILDLYDARPEAKEYLDFFIRPDVDAKLEKAKAAVRKEMWRTSRGRSRARTSRMKRFIKDISSLNPGPEAVVEIMVYTIEQACDASAEQYIKESTQRALAKMMAETLVAADRAGLLSDALPRIESAIAAMPSGFLRTNDFKKLLKHTLKETVESL